jgi:hypothetical protein
MAVSAFSAVREEKLNHCSICLQPMEPNTKDGSLRKVQLLCDHIFHEKCIERWIAVKSTCPLCRFDVSDSKLRYKKPIEAEPFQGQFSMTIGYEFFHFFFER